MTVNTQQELETTREKLRLLERTYEETKGDLSGTAHTRELTLRSLKQLSNQLREEIARQETRASAFARKSGLVLELPALGTK
jgi:hypothetical protein